MTTASFSDVARLPVVERFQTAFQSAFGVSVKLAPPAIPTVRIGFGPAENPLCVMVAGTARGCESCVRAQASVQKNAAKRRGVQQVSCSAGLTEIAVPVIVGGRHVATLLSGQVMRRGPTERDFDLLVQMLAPGPVRPGWDNDLRKAYFETQVLTAEKFNSLSRMLMLFARFLAEAVGTESVASTGEEPTSVVRAKSFIQKHFAEPMDLGTVVQHVSMSRFYFCRLFKKTTGMTLSAYIARIRIERAKELLIDPALRISEVGNSIGFRSIPRFNSAFKLHVGMSPGAYRQSLSGEL